MEHVEARELLSARMDGELDEARAAALEVHLATCVDCRAFEARAARVGVMVRALPREDAPVTSLPPLRVAPRRFTWRSIPALAAVVAVAVLIVVLGPPGRFTMPIPAAASSLINVRTLYVERELVGTEGSTIEHIWFRAPGDLRIERTSPAGSTTTIERPGVRFMRDGTSTSLETGVPPSADVLPEPLSPTIALIGDPKGAGPTIDGRPTIRYDLTFDNQSRRTAYVDATSYAVLGVDQSLILQKSTPANGFPTTTFRVLDLRVNQPIDPALFAIPSGPHIDRGFRVRRLGSLPLHPAATPSGFSLVTAGSSPDGDVMLYSRGSFPLEVDVTQRENVVPTQTTRTETVSLGDVLGKVVLDLYALPRIVFPVGDRFVTIVAPLDRAALMSVAQQMFLL
jgi:hypothetical protein